MAVAAAVAVAVLLLGALALEATATSPPSSALDAPLLQRWLPGAQGEGDQAGGGLYAAEAERAGREGVEETEEMEETEFETDYVTEMLAAQVRQRRRLQAACDTVEPLSTAVANGPVTRATDGTDSDFTAAVAVPGSYVDGEAITAAKLSQAVQGTFTCDSGYEVDTTVTFQCGVPGGAATLSAQPCAVAAVETPDEEEAEEEEAPRCPEDPACRADVSATASLATPLRALQRHRVLGRADRLLSSAPAGSHSTVLRGVWRARAVHVPGLLPEGSLRKGRGRRSQERRPR